MKKYLLILLSIVSFTACQYPENDIGNVQVETTVKGNNQSKTITLSTVVSGIESSKISECGFCYAIPGSTYEEYRSPTVGLKKHTSNKNNNFQWTFGTEMQSNISTARGYIIIDGVTIYSDKTVDVQLMFLNIGL